MDNFRKLLFILMITLLVGNVSAFGITPARNVIDFSPSLTVEKSFTLVNSANENLDIVVYVQGDLAEYIYLSENKFSLSAMESSKEIKYTLKLPSDLKPGLNEGEIIVMNLPGGGSTSEAFVGAVVALSHQVHVNVKFPGKYAETTLNIVGANQGEEVVFVMPVFSRGEHDLASVKANIDIYNKLGEKIDSFNTASISIESGQRKELVHKWKADVPIGKYLAKVALIYDGVTINLEGQFNVGQQELELQSIEVRNFRLGDIAKFEEIIENKWSEPITDVYTEMHIYDPQGKVISEVKSASYSFEPFSKQSILSYWDTEGVKEGNYETIFYLKYAEKSVQKNIELKVSKNDIRVIGLGYVISEDSSDSGDNLVFILVIAIAVLVLINVLWFIMFRKKLKK